MKTILLIEDAGNVVFKILVQLAAKAKVILVSDKYLLRDFGAKIDDGDIPLSDFDAVILDARLQSDKANTQDFLRILRRAGFKGLVLANSRTDNAILMEAGADAENIDKDSAGKVILEMIAEHTAAMYIPAAIREVRKIYDGSAAQWPMLRTLADNLSGLHSTELLRQLDAIKEVEKDLPEASVDLCADICVALKQAGTAKTSEPVALSPDALQVLEALQAHLDG